MKYAKELRSQTLGRVQRDDCAKVTRGDRGTQEIKEVGRDVFIQDPVVLSKSWDFILNAVESL